MYENDCKFSRAIAYYHGEIIAIELHALSIDVLDFSQSRVENIWSWCEIELRLSF